MERSAMIRPAERFPVNITEAKPPAAASPPAKPRRAWEPVTLAVAVAVGAAAGWLLPTGGGSPGPDATALAADPAAPAAAGIEPAAGPPPR
jgi:hypothetical protein